jgi:hypothetical protein
MFDLSTTLYIHSESRPIVVPNIGLRVTMSSLRIQMTQFGTPHSSSESWNLYEVRPWSLHQLNPVIKVYNPDY